MKIIKYNDFIKINESSYAKDDSLKEVLLQYYRIGNLDYINLPKLEGDNKLMFDSMISIIREIRGTDVFTVEFLQPSNYGIKPNGNIGLFDLGFSEKGIKDDSNIENIEVKDGMNIETIFNVKLDKKLGSGMFGTAYDIGDGKVLKLTKDSSEATNSKIIEGLQFEYLTNIYDVKKLTTKVREYYVIIMEKLETPKSLFIMFDNLVKCFDDAMKM